VAGAIDDLAAHPSAHEEAVGPIDEARGYERIE